MKVKSLTYEAITHGVNTGSMAFILTLGGSKNYQGNLFSLINKKAEDFGCKNLLIKINKQSDFKKNELEINHLVNMIRKLKVGFAVGMMIPEDVELGFLQFGLSFISVKITSNNWYRMPCHEIITTFEMAQKLVFNPEQKTTPKYISLQDEDIEEVVRFIQKPKTEESWRLLLPVRRTIKTEII